MTEFVAFAAAGIASAAATPVFGRIAWRIGLVARPRAGRHGQTTVPMLGGAGIGLAVLVTLGAFGWSQALVVITGCGLLVLALGLLDDIRHLAPATKLVGQVLVGATLFVGGVQVEFLPVPPLAFLLTVFWVVAMMNALNLMDNMDGLAAGISAIAAVALALTAIPLGGPVSVASAAIAGAALGFLVHNFPPARVFMGDAGSQLLGFLLAAAALLHTSSGATNVGLALLAPLAVLALPIFDTAFVTASRRLAGRSIGKGGRDHTSHRLAALGMSDRGAVFVLYGVAATFAGLGIFAAALTSVILPLLALAVIALVLFGVFLHEVDVYGKGAGTDGEGAEDAGDVRLSLFRRGWILGRFGAEIGLDAVLLTVAYYAAYLIRFESLGEAGWLRLFSESVPVVVGAQLAALLLLGVYRTVWRYLGVADALAIIRAVAVGTALAAFVLIVGFHIIGYSRAVFALDAILAAALLVSSRSFLLWLRHWFTIRPRSDAVRVLIVGASDRGSFALRLLTSSTQPRYRAVGFIDDDPGKRYRSVAGVRIVGTTADLDTVIARIRAQLVVLALGPHEAAIAARVRESCAVAGVECREFLVPI